MKVAEEKYITLRRLDHYGCIAIPLYPTVTGTLLVRLVKCIHNDKDHRLIEITKNDL